MLAHKTLTPGHPAGKTPPSLEGSPAEKTYVYVPFFQGAQEAKF